MIQAYTPIMQHKNKRGLQTAKTYSILHVKTAWRHNPVLLFDKWHSHSTFYNMPSFICASAQDTNVRHKHTEWLGAAVKCACRERMQHNTTLLQYEHRRLNYSKAYSCILILWRELWAMTVSLKIVISVDFHLTVWPPADTDAGKSRERTCSISDNVSLVFLWIY